jgi:hypothetical protein
VEQPAWAAWLGGGPSPGKDACQLRQPGEVVAKDYLVITAVGNNWTTVDG